MREVVSCDLINKKYQETTCKKSYSSARDLDRLRHAMPCHARKAQSQSNVTIGDVDQYVGYIHSAACTSWALTHISSVQTRCAGIW